MNSHRLSFVFAAALISVVALAGCKKEEPPPPAPVVVEPAPVPVPTPPPVVAVASVAAVDLGNAIGADGKVTPSPTGVFAPKDTITASVTTTTSDLAATVAGTLAAKWSFQDGQVVNEESKSFNFAGPGTTNFSISKPDGWPAGKYKLEVSLDGNVAQTKDFEVK